MLEFYAVVLMSVFVIMLLCEGRAAIGGIFHSALAAAIAAATCLAVVAVLQLHANPLGLIATPIIALVSDAFVWGWLRLRRRGTVFGAAGCHVGGDRLRTSGRAGSADALSALAALSGGRRARGGRRDQVQA
jgi:hypothetical protein